MDYVFFSLDFSRLEEKTDDYQHSYFFYLICILF